MIEVLDVIRQVSTCHANFYVLALIWRVAFFCSVAPRTGRRPSCLYSDDLKERVLVLENEIKYNENSYKRLSLQMKEDNQGLSNKIDKLSEKMDTQIDKLFVVT